MKKFVSEIVMLMDHHVIDSFNFLVVEQAFIRINLEG